MGLPSTDSDNANLKLKWRALFAFAAKSRDEKKETTRGPSIRELFVIALVCRLLLVLIRLSERDVERGAKRDDDDFEDEDALWLIRPGTSSS